MMLQTGLTHPVSSSGGATADTFTRRCRASVWSRHDKGNEAEPDDTVTVAERKSPLKPVNRFRVRHAAPASNHTTRIAYSIRDPTLAATADSQVQSDNDKSESQHLVLRLKCHPKIKLRKYPRLLLLDTCADALKDTVSVNVVIGLPEKNATAL